MHVVSFQFWEVSWHISKRDFWKGSIDVKGTSTVNMSYFDGRIVNSDHVKCNHGTGGGQGKT